MLFTSCNNFIQHIYLNLITIFIHLSLLGKVNFSIKYNLNTAEEYKSNLKLNFLLCVSFHLQRFSRSSQSCVSCWSSNRATIWLYLSTKILPFCLKKRAENEIRSQRWISCSYQQAVASMQSSFSLKELQGSWDSAKPFVLFEHLNSMLPCCRCWILLIGF